MTNAARFIAAHAQTRKMVAEFGVSYRIQFAICLKAAYAPTPKEIIIEVTEFSTKGAIRAIASKCGRYTWFSGRGEYVQDEVEDRSIYQMGYMRRDSFGSDPVPADVKAEVSSFLKAIRVALAKPIAKKPARTRTTDADAAKHRAYCDQHHEGDTGMRSPYSG